MYSTYIQRTIDLEILVLSHTACVFFNTIFENCFSLISLYKTKFSKYCNKPAIDWATSNVFTAIIHWCQLSSYFINKNLIWHAYLSVGHSEMGSEDIQRQLLWLYIIYIQERKIIIESYIELNKGCKEHVNSTFRDIHN